MLVDYRFTGFLDEIYATLVVRLHHTEPFQQDGLWRYAADFKTNTGKQLGVKLTRRAPGVGELEVYFDPAELDVTFQGTPTAFRSISPGLPAAAGYPGSLSENGFNPEGVASWQRLIQPLQG